MKADSATLINHEEPEIHQLSEEDRARLTAQWQVTPLIEMLPAHRRAEAKAILAQRPELRRHLRMCKLGVMDCWQAMERLGMDPYGREGTAQ